VSDKIRFETLVEAFGAKGIPSALTSDSAAAQARCVILEPQKPAFFVAPELDVAPGFGQHRPFWLISAPASVGKSVLAQALAWNLRSRGRQVIYVPLRGSTIGDNFFTGLLASLFPKSSKVHVIDSLRQGRTTILFDGYDELSMTEEQSRLNIGFVEEVLREMKPTNSQSRQEAPSVVFLYRSAIRSLGIFNSIDEYAQQLSLRFFGMEQQIEFLAGYMKFKRPTPYDLRKPCSDFIKAIREKIALPNEETAEGFFGHSPVLMALGDLILEDDSGNPMQIAQDLLKEDFSATQGVALIDRILGQLLEREGQKFPLNIFEAKGLVSFGAYPASMQRKLLTRLVSARIAGFRWDRAIGDVARDECARRLEGNAAFRALASGDQRALQDQYTQEVLQKLQQHPFVDLKNDALDFTNPIYSEKFLAELLVTEPKTDLSRAFDIFAAPSYYLAQFILESLPDRDLKGRENLLFYVIKSLSAGSEAEFQIEISRPDSRWRFSVDSGRLLTAPFWYSDELLILSVPDGQILESMNIEGSHDTIVALDVAVGKEYKRRVTLSNIAVDSGDIELGATHLTLSGVRLTADAIRFDESLQAIEGIDTLVVSGNVKASEFILKKYGRELEAAEASDPDVEAFLRKKLTQMLTWFRKHGAASYGIFRKRFNTVVLAKGKDREAIRVAEFLRSEGILKDVEQMVVLVQANLGRYGVYYVKQNQVKFGKEFSELVARWARYKRDS